MPTFLRNRKGDPRVKVKWAKERIPDLSRLVEIFIGEDPYEIIENLDAKTGEPRFHFRKRREIPDDIPCLAGDILHDLRAALDHLLFSITPRNVAWTRYHGFLVAQSAKEYEARKMRKNSSIKGLPDPLVKRIDAIEPYNGGNGHAVWQIHELNAIDKHRLLLAVGIAQTITKPAVFSHPSMRRFNNRYTVTEFIAMEDGAEIRPVSYDPKMNMKDQFSLSVSFAEPEIIRSEPIVPVLLQFADLVEGIISVFDDVL